MSEVQPVAADERLRIAVLADFDGVHARSWLSWFVARGHDVHAVSYYPPRAPLEGVTVHVLRPRSSGAGQGGASVRGLRSYVPAGVTRLANALRYRRAGLARAVREIAPDLLHAHFVVEHGLYGLMAGFRPYVVTAWGSDVLVAPERDMISRRIARYVMGRADLLTSNNAFMAQRMAALGADSAKVEVVVLGADRYFLDAWRLSTNVREDSARGAATVISTRAHEPLYNIAEIIDAYGRVARRRPDSMLRVLNEGSLTRALQWQASAGEGRIQFHGTVDRATFCDALIGSEVFVSVPSSDGTSVALLQAMAVGCFPIVSDLETQREWIDDGVNGFRVPLHRPDVLADRIAWALADPELRKQAAERNRAIVEARGLNEREMARMEGLYRGLAQAQAKLKR